MLSARWWAAVVGLAIALSGVVVAVVGLTMAPHVQAGPGPATTVVTTTPPSLTKAPTTPAVVLGPADVVEQYVAAINAHDYQRAWTLGGQNLGQSYPAFVAGFAGTDHDELTIESVRGDVVTIDLVAVQTDGGQHTYHGTYTVVGNMIKTLLVHRTG